jgi:hypothetical protein
MRNKIKTDEHGLAGKSAETGTCGLLSSSRGTSANSEDGVPGEQVVLREARKESQRRIRVGGALSLLGFFADGCCFVLVGQSVENTGTLTYTKRHEKVFSFLE